MALLAIAGLINTAGYLFNLWHDKTIFDEAVHMFTTFAGIAAIGFLGHRAGWLPSGARRWFAMLALGLVLGIAWEFFELAIGIIGSPRDTIIDLAMDVLGAFAAAVLISAVSANCATANKA